MGVLLAGNFSCSKRTARQLYFIPLWMARNCADRSAMLGLQKVWASWTASDILGNQQAVLVWHWKLHTSPRDTVRNLNLKKDLRHGPVFVINVDVKWPTGSTKEITITGMTIWIDEVHHIGTADMKWKGSPLERHGALYVKHWLVSLIGTKCLVERKQLVFKARRARQQRVVIYLKQWR